MYAYCTVRIDCCIVQLSMYHYCAVLYIIVSQTLRNVENTVVLYCTYNTLYRKCMYSYGTIPNCAILTSRYNKVQYCKVQYKTKSATMQVH